MEYGIFITCMLCVLLIAIVIIVSMQYRGMKKQFMQLEKKNELDRTILNACRSFEEIYVVDLSENYYKMIYPKEDKEEYGNYAEAIEKHMYSGKIIDDDDRVREFLSPESLKKELSERDYTECKYMRKLLDGTEAWCITRFNVLEKKNNVPVKVTMAIRNIDEVVKINEKQKSMLSEEAKQARDTSEIKTKVLSRLSHDIRTPLNSILGMTTIGFMHIDDKERVKKALNEIHISGTYLLGMINQLLDITRIENGKCSLSEENFNIRDSIEGIVSVVENDIRKKNIVLTKRFENFNHEEVFGDSKRFEQIIVNILENAVKFTPYEGKIDLTVREKMVVDNLCAAFEIIIRDNGIGMDQEFVDEIFEPFSRAENSVELGIEGTGLGMSIANSLTKLMKGTIDVKSKLGEGSEFRINLFFKVNKTDEKMIKKMNFEEFGKLDFSGKKLLVVDDSDASNELIEEMLSYVGIETVKVNNGVQAIELLENSSENEYDIVFMDIHMPRMSGYEAVRRIRALEEKRRYLADIPIIAMSADVMDKAREKARKSGMNDHLAKPIELGKLVEIIEKWL